MGLISKPGNGQQDTEPVVVERQNMVLAENPDGTIDLAASEAFVKDPWAALNFLKKAEVFFLRQAMIAMDANEQKVVGATRLPGAPG